MTSKNKMQRLAMLPIFLTLVILPLILHFQEYRTNLETYDWQSADAVYDVDIFLLPKSMILCVIAAFMLVLFIGFKYYKDGMLTETYPLLVYALLIGFSTLCSQYKYFALHGGQDQFESIFVLLAASYVYCY